jgi:phosphoglycolate phosphatase
MVGMTAIGFDLDMTLVDTRPGIEAALLALAAETGRDIDVKSIVSALGPPVADALAPWFAPDELPEAVNRFRRHMARVGVMNVAPLPGAADALEAARSAGYLLVVVTSKIEPLARETLRHAGLAVDLVFGDVWSTGKAGPLRAAGAVAYVGDHPADMRAAAGAGVPGVAVTSGSSTADELEAEGAAVVLDSLRGFAGWLARAELPGPTSSADADELLGQ